MTVFQVSCVAGVEPAVLINGVGSGFGLPVITGGDRFAPEQYLIVLSDLHFNVGHQRTHRTYLIAFVRETGNGGGRFRQPVPHYHIDAYGMYKLADFIGYGSSGGGKEVSVLNADRLFQQGVDSLFIELILQVKQQRGVSCPHADSQCCASCPP